MLGAALTYAIFLIGSGRNSGRIGSLRFSALAISIASGFVLAQFFIMRPAASLFTLPAKIYWLGIALAWFSTALPIFLTVEAIRRVRAAFPSPDPSGRSSQFGLVTSFWASRQRWSKWPEPPSCWAEWD